MSGINIKESSTTGQPTSTCAYITETTAIVATTVSIVVLAAVYYRVWKRRKRYPTNPESI